MCLVAQVNPTPPYSILIPVYSCPRGAGGRIQPFYILAPFHSCPVPFMRVPTLRPSVLVTSPFWLGCVSVSCGGARCSVLL
eukprot:scaffold23184_cov84-Isochrysis_galbana.AAC.2